MKAIICDCCGKIIKLGESVREIEIRKSDGTLVENNGYYKKEICVGCSDRVQAFIDGFKDMPCGIGVE